jgi:hypothetical protein
MIMAAPQIRLRTSTPTLEDNLGLLKFFPGTWIGSGFNLIARPQFSKINGQDNDHFLEINMTQEVMKFELVGAPIPNRGLAQDDITLFGVHYLQQISDAVTFGALHIEPGFWLNIPSSVQPLVPGPTGGPPPASPDLPTINVARLATIPHGNGLVAQGNGFSVAGRPIFKPANTTPFVIAANTPVPFPEFTLSNPSVFRTNPLPPASAISAQRLQDAVNNPNVLLEDAIQDQQIIQTIVFNVATSADIVVGGTTPSTHVKTFNGGGGIENIDFLKSLAVGPNPDTRPRHGLPNAVAAEMFATFWIETVQNPFGDGTFLQMQYSQTVNLNFAGLTWPHVSVATLVKSSVVG